MSVESTTKSITKFSLGQIVTVIVLIIVVPILVVPGAMRLWAWMKTKTGSATPPTA